MTFTTVLLETLLILFLLYLPLFSGFYKPSTESLSLLSHLSNVHKPILNPEKNSNIRTKTNPHPHQSLCQYLRYSEPAPVVFPKSQPISYYSIYQVDNDQTDSLCWRDTEDRYTDFLEDYQEEVELKPVIRKDRSQKKGKNDTTLKTSDDVKTDYSNITQKRATFYNEYRMANAKRLEYESTGKLGKEECIEFLWSDPPENSYQTKNPKLAKNKHLGHYSWSVRRSLKLNEKNKGVAGNTVIDYAKEEIHSMPKEWARLISRMSKVSVIESSCKFLII